MAALRDFRLADLEAVRGVLKGIGWEAQYVEGQAESLRALPGHANARAMVAVEAGEVVGFVTVLFAPWNRLAQVHGLAVAPGFQRRGVASALVGAAEWFARARGGRGVFVDTPVDNAAARAFYAANGYAEAYVMPEYYAEGLDGVTYLKLFEKGKPARF
jgi:ribosomal protein S18 acetylase RimI-like enzyme